MFKTKQELEDAIIKQDYLRSQGLLSFYISPKEKKVKKAVALYGKTAKYWKKMKSKNLGKLLLDNNNGLERKLDTKQNINGLLLKKEKLKNV